MQNVGCMLSANLFRWTSHLVDKVAVGNLINALIKVGAWLKASQPLLALLDLLFGECQLDGLVIMLACGHMQRVASADQSFHDKTMTCVKIHGLCWLL